MILVVILLSFFGKAYALFYTQFCLPPGPGVSYSSECDFVFNDPTSAEPIPAIIYQAGTLCQGQSLDHCIEVYSCGSNHFIDSFSGNSGTVIVAPPSAPSDTCFRYTAPFSMTGNDTVTFIVKNEFGFQFKIILLVF